MVREAEASSVIIVGEKRMEGEGNVSSLAACYVPDIFLFNPYNSPGTKDCCSLEKVDERSDISKRRLSGWLLRGL